MGKVINVQASGGIGITAKSGDAISGFIVQAPAPAVGQTYVLNSVYKFGATEEVEALGIDEAYDVTGGVSVYQPIKEFFETNPKGTLYLQLTSQTSTPVEMLTPATATSAIKLVNYSEGQVKQLGVGFNPSVAPADYDVAIAEAISQANLFALYCFQNDRPVHLIIEGIGMTGATNTRTLLSKHVSVMLGQNDAFYSKGAFAQKHTSIGRALGVVSKAKVNESIGWIGGFNLLGGDFQAARIDGILIKDKTPTQLQTLSTNGYLFFETQTDFPGIYMSGSHTCTTATDDYSTIEKNRTWNKAARLVRQAMLPFVNSTVFIDTNTGLIDPMTIAVMESAGNKALRAMFQASEISGPDPQGPRPPFQIDPNQDVLATSELITQVSITPTGVAETITNYIGFKNPNN